MAGTCEGCGRYVDSWGCFDCYLDDLAPEPLTHAAAVSGCTGTGEGFDMSALGTVYSTPTEPVHWHWEGSLTPPGWFEWKGAPDWEREHPTAPLPVEFVHVRCCTATTAVLEGVGR